MEKRRMLFDSTVRRELARSFGATLVVILTIVLTMFLVRTCPAWPPRATVVEPQDVVLVLGYTALGHLPTMLSLSLFVAIVRHARAHVPRQRDGHLVRQRHRPGALRAPGAAHLLAGAAGDRVLLLAVRLALGQPQQQELRDRYQRSAPTCRACHPGCSRPRRTTARACSSSSATATERPPTVSVRNVFALSTQGRR